MGLFGKAKDAMKAYDNVKATRKLTYDELLEIMKEGKYSVGEPEIVGSGIMRCIKFPEVDKYRIQVSVSGSTITISKVYNGVGGMLKESAGNALTGGWYDVANKENTTLNKATREIGETLSGLLEAKGLLKTK